MKKLSMFLALTFFVSASAGFAVASKALSGCASGSCPLTGDCCGNCDK